MLRVAQVDEVRASTALADASADVRRRSLYHDELLAIRSKVDVAHVTCLSSRSSLDLARYEMIGKMQASSDIQLNESADMLSDAAKIREKRVTESLMTKKKCERLGNHARSISVALERQRSQAALEEDTQLWLASMRCRDEN